MNTSLSSVPTCIGIDLGTSNTAICISGGNEENQGLLPIKQILRPGTVASETLLPSCLYISGEDEFPVGSFNVCWQNGAEDTADSREHLVVGRFAKDQGALVPDRVVTSAKSWLSTAHVQRRSPILPWQSTAVTQKVSPVQVSALILEHCRNAIQEKLEPTNNKQQVVITVPASFDEVARALTIEAASEAGLSDVLLLEEPQAALYAWLHEHSHDWRDLISTGSLILVCDVGGGTTDFSIVSVIEVDGALSLERVSVGEHILLGGDNFDIALAYMAQAKLEEETITLDSWQFQSLVHSARKAKEHLLSSDNPVYKFSIASRGSSLFASTISAEINKEMVDRCLEGFFPLQDIASLPENTSSGIQEHGLPYAQDPRFTAHLASFLQNSAHAIGRSETLSSFIATHIRSSEGVQFLRPDAILFNGGIFNAQAMQQRVQDILQQWLPGERISTLTTSSTDTAVARGAAYYGSEVLHGDGIRIKATTSRSYYLGIESSMPAVPGFKPPLKALCVVPMGMEEGSSCEITGKRFDLVTGKPVSFTFYGASSRGDDTAGTILPRVGDDLFEAGTIETVISRATSDDMAVCPVYVEALLTETGTLELWLKEIALNNSRTDSSDGSDDGQHRWKLEFNVRE
jgi:molecular chaperone DnaK (HSP70)